MRRLLIFFVLVCLVIAGVFATCTYMVEQAGKGHMASSTLVGVDARRFELSVRCSLDVDQGHLAVAAGETEKHALCADKRLRTEGSEDAL